MYSKTLFAALALLSLTGSPVLPVLGAPTCAVQSTTTVTAGESSTSAVISSANVAAATSVTSVTSEVSSAASTSTVSEGKSGKNKGGSKNASGSSTDVAAATSTSVASSASSSSTASEEGSGTNNGGSEDDSGASTDVAAATSVSVASSSSSTSTASEGKTGKNKGGSKNASGSSSSSASDAASTGDVSVSSRVAAESNTCPAQSTVTVTATADSDSAATNVAAATSTTSSATSTSTSSKGKGGKNKGGSDSSSSTTSSADDSASTSRNAAASTSTSTSASGSTSTGNSASTDDEQSATTLNAAVIATGFALDGQETPAAGQVASLTSTNNFINFCLTVDKPITNGQQIKTGSCNPAPIGVIAATTNMPASKFVNPKNFGTIQANTAFTIQMAINNIETGNFVNAQSNYYSAPQQVNGQGNIIGHTHVVIEQLDSLDQTTVTDPTKFAFFKGVNGAAVNGVVTADVTDGLPAGAYRLASINAAANHQPVLVAVAQHGSLDDMVYFTVE